jgi:hypothetical protein
MQLYRPVGLAELRLLAATGFRRFPPRLPHQPIFYPVLSREYAEAIARDWNTRDEASGFAGFVTRFDLDDAHATRYPVRLAGSSAHQELWVPAEDLPSFNDHILGPIAVVAAFTGSGFAGTLDPTTLLPTDLG